MPQGKLRKHRLKKLYPNNVRSPAWVAWMLGRKRRNRSRGPYVVFTNFTDRFGMQVKGSGTLTVDWDDGTTSSYALSGADQNVTKVYATAATRSITMVGNITKINADETAPLGGVGSFGCAGDLSKLPNLDYIRTVGANLTSCLMQEWPGITSIYCGGLSPMCGAVQPWPLLTDLGLWGLNACHGNMMPWPSITKICLVGYNTVGGPLQSWPLVTYILFLGNNTAWGTLGSWPGMTYLSLGGFNTVTGSVAAMTVLQYLKEGGSCNLTHPADWSPFLGLCYVEVKNLAQSEVDNLLVSMDANTGQTKLRVERTVICTAGCAGPSGTGLAAKASLIGKGYSVTTN